MPCERHGFVPPISDGAGAAALLESSQTPGAVTWELRRGCTIAFLRSNRPDRLVARERNGDN